MFYSVITLIFKRINRSIDRGIYLSINYLSIQASDVANGASFFSSIIMASFFSPLGLSFSSSSFLGATFKYHKQDLDVFTNNITWNNKT